MVECGDESVSAPVIVNAAGAWAGSVAEQAGISGLGLQPMQRTAVLIDPRKFAGQNQGLDMTDWPTLQLQLHTTLIKYPAFLLLLLYLFVNFESFYRFFSTATNHVRTGRRDYQAPASRTVG